MQVSVETTGNLERKLTIELPPEQVDTQVQQRLGKLQKTANMKGFRKGKVPQNVLKRVYGESVRIEVMEEVMRKTLSDAIEAQNLKPAGMPKIEPKEMGEGKSFSYVATFEVFPEFELHDLSGEALETTTASVSDDDVQNAIAKLRQQHAEWIEVERAAEDGDKISIDFEGLLDGEAFEGGSATDFAIEIGVTQMIPGFVEGLIGAKAGEARELNLCFPSDYGHEDLAGKDVIFKVTVNKVQAAKLPELDDAFFEKLQISDKSQAGLEKEIRDNLQHELDDVLLVRLKESVFEKLQAKNPIDIPQALIDDEVNNMRQNLVRQMGGKMSLEHVPSELFVDEAQKRVHVGLLVNEVVKQNELKVDEDKVRARIEDMASRYDSSQELIDYYYNNKQLLSQIEMQVLEQQVAEHLMAGANVSEKAASFDEVMNKTNESGTDDNTEATTAE